MKEDQVNRPQSRKSNSTENSQLNTSKTAKKTLGRRSKRLCSLKGKEAQSSGSQHIGRRLDKNKSTINSLLASCSSEPYSLKDEAIGNQRPNSLMHTETQKGDLNIILEIEDLIVDKKYVSPKFLSPRKASKENLIEASPSPIKLLPSPIKIDSIEDSGALRRRIDINPKVLHSGRNLTSPYISVPLLSKKRPRANQSGHKGEESSLSSAGSLSKRGRLGTASKQMSPSANVLSSIMKPIIRNSYKEELTAEGVHKVSLVRFNTMNNFNLFNRSGGIPIYLEPRRSRSRVYNPMNCRSDHSECLSGRSHSSRRSRKSKRSNASKRKKRISFKMREDIVECNVKGNSLV